MYEGENGREQIEGSVVIHRDLYDWTIDQIEHMLFSSDKT